MYIVKFTMPAQLETPEQQLDVIRGISSHSDYISFYLKYFFEAPQNCYWLNKLNDALLSAPGLQSNPEYFRLLALAANQFAQFGTPSLEGQIFRHRARRWVNPPFDSRHQLAIACYGARINQEAFSMKQRFHDIFESQGNINAMNGAWSFFFYVQDGQLLKHALPGIDEVREEAEYRALQSSRPICLPNQELNDRLASIKFGQGAYDSTVADSISPEDFRREVYPQAYDILKGLMDVEAALLS